MSVTHSDLVARLQIIFPAQDGSPAAAQYDAAVVSGIAEFSQCDNRIKRASINIVSGTGSYPMPADFLKLVSFDDIFESSTIVQPGGKLIATDTTMQEELHWFDGANLIISPTPQYTLTRYFQYKAKHVQDANGNYAELGCVFRRKRSPFPDDADHPDRMMPIALSGACRPPGSETTLDKQSYR